MIARSILFCLALAIGLVLGLAIAKWPACPVRHHANNSGAPARPAWKAEASTRTTGKGVIAGDEWRKRPVLGNARIHPLENAGVTRPKLHDDPRQSNASGSVGESRRRDLRRSRVNGELFGGVAA